MNNNERSVSGSNHSTTDKRLYYGWAMVAVAFVAQGISSGGITYSYSVIAVTLNDEFDVSRLLLMMPMTAMTLAGLIVAPLIGPKIDKFPIRNFMLVGTLLGRVHIKPTIQTAMR